jgi:hypothetical protein
LQHGESQDYLEVNSVKKIISDQQHFYSWTKTERAKQSREESGIVKLPSLQLTIGETNKIILEHGEWKIILPPGYNKVDAITAIELVESRNVS